MVHALRYFCSWETEVYKHQMRLELWEKDYKGEATAMVLSGEPKLTMDEGDTICGSSLDFGLLSETNGQYLHLYTTDNHKYLIKILRDGAVMWEGYLLPEYYSEAYIAAPYTVNFTATDWLGMLKNVDFPAEDTRVPILQIIKTCLQYTELPLDFACQMDLRVEGINDTTNILGALYLNPITFTGYNCYEVLEKILASFNATLRQTGHRWLISSIDDELPLRLISWDNLTYTGDGESNNGELIGTNFAGTFIDGSMTMAISPAKKSVDLSQDIFYRESWLKDYDFHSADAWELHGNILKRLPGWLYTKNPDNGELIKQTYVEYLRVRPLAIVADNNYISQVINVEGAPDNSEYTLGIKFLTPTLLNGDNTTVMYVKIINRSSTSLTQDVAYLSVNGWTNDDSEIELNGTSTEPEYLNSRAYYDKDGNLEWAYKKDNWPITKINFISIPYSGTLEIRIRLRDIAIYEKKHPLNPHFSHYFGGVYLTKTNVNKNLTISSSLNPDAAETASSVNLMLCDSPEERNVELGVLNYFSLSDGALTTGKKWYYNGQEYEDFLHAIAYSYSRCYANKRQKLSGALYTDKIYNLCSFTDKWSGKRHTIKSWNYSIISERLDSMEIIETPAKEIELTLSTPEAGSSNKQNQPSGGTSGGGSTSMAGSGRYVNLDTAQEVSGEKTWNDKATFKKNIVVEGDGIFGGEVSGIVGDGTPAGVTDYSALTGKPSINGKELVSGDNSLEALGIQPKGDYTTATQLATTLADYATKVFVSNNYVGKSAFNNHTADTDIHITSAERLAWNAKWNYDEATIKAVKVNAASSADSVAWSGISGKPTTFTPSAHTHTASDITGLPTKLSAFTNDVGFITGITKSMVEGVLTGDITSHTHSYLPLSGGTITGLVTFANNLISLNGLLLSYVDGALRVNTQSGNSSFGMMNDYACHIYTDAPRFYTNKPLYVDNGNVIIGTTNNGYKLDVNGTGHYSGDLVCGGEVVAVAGEGTPAGVTDYSALTGKPQINGVTLISGNNTLASLGIQAAGDYATNSGVTTLLANYADKTFVSNNYASKAAFNSHTADSDIHITAAERGAWNAKWDYNENTIKAVKVNSALSADKSTSLIDYGNTSKTIQIGYAGAGLSTSNLSHVAGYTDNGTKIKDVSKSVLQSWLELGTAAYTASSAYAASSHTHTASEVSGLPTKLSAFTNDVGFITGITKSMVEGVLTGDISSHTHTFASLTSKPTTIAGYGITDALTTSNYNSYAPTLTGVGASGTWGINISGNAATATNATNADKLANITASTYFKNKDFVFNSEWGAKYLWTLWDNHLYAADKRFAVTLTGATSANFELLFDGNFESYIEISSEQAVLHIKHTTDGNIWSEGLPYGSFYVVFYNSDAENVTGRVYCKYAAQGIGWHTLGVTHINSNVWKLDNIYYQLSDLEITITKPTNSSYINLCQILHEVDRSPGPYYAAVMSKYCNQKTNYTIEAAKFIGPLQGNANTANSLIEQYVSNLDSASYGRVFSGSFQATNTPATNYATGLTLYNVDLGYTYQLAFSTIGNIYTRYKNTTDWQNWKTIAFTDSNVASATKLQTPRNIWGQPFDGMSDVNGDAHITGDLIVDGEVSALVA